MNKKKIIIAILASIMVLSLAACNKDKEKPNDIELGEINKPSNIDNDFLEKDMSVLNEMNVYEGDNYKSFSVGEDINIKDIKDSDLIVGKMLILSQNDLNKFDEKEIKYVKGDLDGLINTYHKIISKVDTSNIEIIKDEKSVLLNFNSFSPMLYMTSNKLFTETYIEQGTKRSDVPLKEEGKERALEGYYRTIKANFPDIDYVYFQYMGNPWEAIQGETHDGLLFMEPGQKKPDKAPDRLFKTFDPEKFDKDSGWSTNYSGDRNVNNQTQTVTPQNDFTNGDSYINTNNQSQTSPNNSEKPVDTNDEKDIEIISPEEAEKRSRENPLTKEELEKEAESGGEKLTPEQIEELKKQLEKELEEKTKSTSDNTDKEVSQEKETNTNNE